MIRPIAIAACLLIAGCGSLTTPTAEQPAEAVEVAEIVEAPVEQTDYLAQGKAEGYEAAVAAQSAGDGQWLIVASQWDAAIATLGRVPADSPDHAEAQTKVAEYTANRDVASTRYNAYLAEVDKVEAEANEALLDNYRAEMRRIDPTGELVVRVEPDPFMKDCGSCIDITVGTGFLSQNKATRLEAAKQLWTLWVYHSAVTSADDARIRLVTQSGTKVGGSGMMGGSMVYVDD